MGTDKLTFFTVYVHRYFFYTPSHNGEAFGMGGRSKKKFVLTLFKIIIHITYILFLI